MLLAKAAHQDQDVAKMMMYKDVKEFCDARVAEFAEIEAGRKEELGTFANYIAGKVKAGQEIKAIVICTHNSRRSHLGQVWSAVAADYYGIQGFESFSGGTEGTAFYQSAVDALRSQGLTVHKGDEIDNPRYQVKWNAEMAPAVAFSKRFDESPNPTADFAALMVCTSADDACPVVFGADFRLAIPYVDPKAFDGTDQAAEKYEERSRQIAREMLFVFSKVGTH